MVHHDRPHGVSEDAISAPLSTLALDAAVEIERMLIEGDGRDEVVRRFMMAVKRPLREQGTAPAYIVDPLAINAYEQAITSARGHEVATVAQLQAEIDEYDLTFPARNTDEWKTSAEALKKFCLSLHRVLLDNCARHADDETYLGSIFDERSPLHC